MSQSDRTEQTTKRAPGVSRRIAVVLVSLVLSLGAAELAVRALGLAPEAYPVQAGRFRVAEDPRIGYELVPHFESASGGPMLDFRGKANSLGFRDREHAVEKADGTFRVIVLGDSIVQGLGIEDDAALLTSVMERTLRGDGENVDVMNFGVSGYCPRQEVATLETKGLAFDPDLVLIAVCVNDTDPSGGGILTSLQRAAEGTRNPATPPAILSGSALARLAYGVARAGTEATTAPPASELRRDTVTESLEDLGRLGRERGFEVGVVWFPRFVRDPPEADTVLYERVRGVAQEQGFDFVDLSPELSQALEHGPIALDSIHPSTFGHRAAGLALARLVKMHVRTNRDRVDR